ncbi:MAG TPA: DUF5996 family protein [Blastocatellia bacterium]|nr:DUF5996 family protein [Blastocatellia bacterium]
MNREISPAGDSTHLDWPSLPFNEWKDTYATLHMWTQIVGKIRLARTPWINHSWHTTLYVTSRGLTTSPIPYGDRTFQIDFDFIDHDLLIRTSDGAVRDVQLAPRSVADFYRELFAKMAELKLDVAIHGSPNEVAEPIPFAKDVTHAAYDSEYANRFWRALVQADRVFTKFRARFIGKCSPVHFFWGSFDLAVTRFSGRRAPVHPGGIPHLPDWVTREAYSHEVSSCGFWPGSEQMPEAVFYSYAYPVPDGFDSATVGPRGAYFSADMREFIFPYEQVRQSASPDEALLEFLQTSYEAAADAGHWDRSELETTTYP